MKKCSIICYTEDDPKILLKDIDKDSYIICADQGLKFAMEAGIRPDLVIGDFDSYTANVPDDMDMLKLPVMKDDSDTGYAVDYSIKEGAKEITIYGGLGGRFDQSVANLQIMAGAAKEIGTITLLTCNDEVYVTTQQVEIEQREGYYLSVFPLGGNAKGVTIKGTLYELTDHTMPCTGSLGVSNEITGNKCTVSVKDGILAVILSKKRRT